MQILPPSLRGCHFAAGTQALRKAVQDNNADMHGCKRARSTAPYEGPLLPLSNTRTRGNPSAAPPAHHLGSALATPCRTVPSVEAAHGLAPAPGASSKLRAEATPFIPTASAPFPVQDEGAAVVGTGGVDMAVDTDTDLTEPQAPAEDECPLDEHAVDDLLDEHEEDDPLGDPSAMGLCWWKSAPFDSVLSLECVTAGYVPEGVEHAVATLKGQLADHICSRKAAADKEGELLGWKALLAVDALLFFDLRGGEAISRKALVADRIRMCEHGHWGTLWAHAEMQTSTGPQDEDDELEKTATRVTKLMEAKEISKGASAVWGTGDRVPPQEIEQKVCHHAACCRSQHARPTKSILVGGTAAHQCLH